MIDWYERRSSYVLVMERPERHIDLFDYLNQAGPIREPIVRDLFIQILDAIIHCHNNGVLHRDIKDENVLIDPNGLKIKLIDFGSAVEVFGLKAEDVVSPKFCGTIKYCPPEAIENDKFRALPADIWAMGILLFTLFHGGNPFSDIHEIRDAPLEFDPQ